RVHDARHGDGAAGLPPRRDRARDLHPDEHAGARHGRPLGVGVPRRTAGSEAVRRPARRQDDRMNGRDAYLRLLAALLALAAGAVAILVVVLLLRDTIG